MSRGCVSIGRGVVHPMKFVLPLLLLCLVSLAHGQGCPTGQQKDPATLVQIEQVWLRAVEQHDKAALRCILADEFEEAGFDGSLINRSAMLATATKPSTVTSNCLTCMRMSMAIPRTSAGWAGQGAMTENSMQRIALRIFLSIAMGAGSV
jgi:hypothetical protein